MDRYFNGFYSFNAFYNYAEKMSPLGNATAEECANYCIFLFSDLSKKITMQNLFHDGGFSSTGISEDIIDQSTGEVLLTCNQQITKELVETILESKLKKFDIPNETLANKMSKEIGETDFKIANIDIMACSVNE